MHSQAHYLLLACAASFLSVTESHPLEKPSGSCGWRNPKPDGSQKPNVYAGEVSAAYDALQKWYNETTGLWTSGWWNSANALTMVADFAIIHEPRKEDFVNVFATTYERAALHNLGITKTSGSVENGWEPHTTHQEAGLSPDMMKEGYLDGFYDDEGWWALAWIAAYDVTRNSQYLQEAELIFDDMYQVFGKTPCSKNSGGVGGIWWDKAHTYVNAIANELFLDVAARLASRVPSKRDHYMNIAKRQWSWFKASGMINSDNLINDGLDGKTCKNNDGATWSYNQGVILGGLSAMSLGTGDHSYIAEAQTLADASTVKLSRDGILHDGCEPNCGPDASQFKGVLTRNLGYLHSASPQTRYATFLRNNANSIWAHDRNQENQLSIDWSGPFVNPANATTHSSAMDTLVAALALR